LILADDLGYGDLGCYGQRFFHTPRLDKMAAEGMRFTQHYAGSTVCAPSRACLLTGQHTGHVYQRANGPYQLRRDPHDVTIARRLKDAGYQTALIGKSGLSSNSDDGRLPNDKGFDYFFGFTSHQAAHRYYPEWLWRNGRRVAYPGNHGKEGDVYSGDIFLQETLAWLEAHRDGPFFLHLALQQPHADLNVPTLWRESFVGKFDETPHPDNHYRGESHPKATFAGMVAYLDDSVGRVLDKLRELGIAERTLVIFSSDNGAMSEGGWDRRYFHSCGPLRGGKRDMYEGGIRVPAIAWWPGTVRPGSVTDHVSAFWDFTPTACEAAGIEPPHDSDGISYLPTLAGRGEQRDHDYLYWEFYEQGGKQAVRWRNWKGIRLNVGSDPEAPIELYNLENDLAETTNVADQHVNVARQIETMMREAHSEWEIMSFAAKRPK
jgi:arylsulfatase A-like enzyme